MKVELGFVSSLGFHTGPNSSLLAIAESEKSGMEAGYEGTLIKRVSKEPTYIIISLTEIFGFAKARVGGEAIWAPVRPTSGLDI